MVRVSVKIPSKTKAPENKINNTKPGKSNYFAQHRFTWREKKKQATLFFVYTKKSGQFGHVENLAPEHQAVKLADGGHELNVESAQNYRTHLGLLLSSLVLSQKLITVRTA